MKTCPECGSHDILGIMYGKPSSKADKLVAEGKAVYDGCTVKPDSPRWMCRDCSHKFGIFKPRA